MPNTLDYTDYNSGNPLHIVASTETIEDPELGARVMLTAKITRADDSVLWEFDGDTTKTVVDYPLITRILNYINGAASII